jgi:metal-sulfur cluster biosynthetic enzyme
MSDEPADASAADARRELRAAVWTSEQVREVLRGVFDPELHMNIVDLGSDL